MVISKWSSFSLPSGKTMVMLGGSESSAKSAHAPAGARAATHEVNQWPGHAAPQPTEPLSVLCHTLALRLLPLALPR